MWLCGTENATRIAVQENLIALSNYNSHFLVYLLGVNSPTLNTHGTVGVYRHQLGCLSVGVVYGENIT